MSVTRVTIQNRTGRPLVPYLMVNTNLGLRRLPQAALTVPSGSSYEVNPAGGDPVFFDPHNRGDVPRQGVLVELSLGHKPCQLSSTVYGYMVPPDQAHYDPENAPIDGQRTERCLAPGTTAVTISLGHDFAVSFDEHGGAVAAPF